MTETEYLAFLRETAERVDVMLSGLVKTEGGARVRVDPQKVRKLLRESITRFRGWWEEHHDVDAKPNPIDWATPEGRRLFTGDRQLACYCTTLCAIHDSNKNRCVDVPGWRLLGGLLYQITCARDQQAGYDENVVAEAVRGVSEHLAREPAVPRQAEKRRKKTPSQVLKQVREEHAARELLTNPEITARELGNIRECDASTVVRLKAWKKRGVLYRDPPRAQIEDRGQEDPE